MTPNNPTHYGLENRIGPDYTPCANRPAAATEQLTPVMDDVTCMACVIALVHKAVRFVTA